MVSWCHQTFEICSSLQTKARHCPFNPPAVDIATLERTNDKTCGPWFAKPQRTPTSICDGAWESEQKGTSAHLLRLLPQHRFRISQKLDAGCGSAIVSQPCPQSDVALETEEIAKSVDISRNGPTAEIYASLRFLFLTPPLGTFDLIMKSWQVEPVLYHLTSEVPQSKASICASHQAPWG